ncbi:hypothetical protein P7C73_g3866, partial [Tremellales sp. Uapishka_1]
MSDAQHTDGSNYGYTPTPAWCIVFITLFSLSAAVHAVSAFRAKSWIVYPTLVLGALIEVTGWSGRYWSSQNVTLLSPFLMQIVTLILAPVFFSAYDYVVLGMAINRLGPQYSYFRPRWYFIIFITADVISLVLQAVGGGQAASTAGTSSPTKSATDIMVAGIVFQLFSMFVFICFGIDFVIRTRLDKPYYHQQQRLATKQQALQHVQSAETAIGSTQEKTQETQLEQEEERRKNMGRWWLMLSVVMISSLMIFIRGIYRSIELSEGWEAKLTQTEIFQNCLDGIPMIIAVGIYNFVNPGYLFPRRSSWKGYH